jgi:AcrR family transcriptional regulator
VCSVPRKYEQRVRAEAAERTKRSVVAALYQRLRETPDKPVGIDEVAKAAGVARSTVYLVFGSRAGLFDALADELLSGGGFEQIMTAKEQPDARRHMEQALTGGTHMYAEHRDVFRVLFSIARLDADAGATIATREAARKAGIGRLGKRLEKERRLRPGLTARDASDLVWMLAGFEAFDALYTDRGLSAIATARTLVETAERALLVRPSSRRTSSPGTR